MLDRYSPALIFVGLLVVGGILSSNTRPSSDAPDVAQTNDQARKTVALRQQPGVQTPALDLIERFFGILPPSVQESAQSYAFEYVPATAPDPDLPDDADSAGTPLGRIKVTDEPPKPVPDSRRIEKLATLAAGHGFDVHFLIATVPDPVDSHVGWQFDPVVDSIQRAFESRHFVLDRFYFPWRQTAEPTNSQSVILQQSEHSRTAGVLLFRPTSMVTLAEPSRRPEKGSLFVVLLVGETPTRGIHKVALARALTLIAKWHAITHTKRPSAPVARSVTQLPTVPIPVPRIANSMPRLVGGLFERGNFFFSRFLDEFERATRFISQLFDESVLEIRLLGPAFSAGSLTLRIAIEEWMADGACHPCFVHFEIISGRAQDIRNKPTLQFVAENTTGDNRWLVWSDFHSTMVPSDTLSKLFLQQFFDERNIDRSQTAMLIEANTVYGEDVAQPPIGEKRGINILTIRYPMQIGRMRTAYERQLPVQASLSLPGESPPRTRLPLSLLEVDSANDLPPPLSPLSAASTEAILSNTLSALSRRGIRYLGIQGTDPADILFLAHLAHESCPDVQLFTTHGDLLYTHPDYRRYVNGMYVVSPYPLFGKSQLWSVAGAHGATRLKRHQFSNGWAEGTYNATLALMSQQQSTTAELDYGAPFGSAKATYLRPPVWVVVLNNGAFWPVRCYPEYKSNVTDVLIEQTRSSPSQKDAQHQNDTQLQQAAFEEVQAELEAFHYRRSRSDDYVYTLPAGPARAANGQKEISAAKMEIPIGLTGPAGFAVLLLGGFSVMVAAQYLIVRTDVCWSRRREISAGLLKDGATRPSRMGRERRFYDACFFLSLGFAQVLLLSPMIVLRHFDLDFWTLHLGEKIVFVIGELGILATLVALSVLSFVDFGGKKIAGECSTKKMLPGFLPAMMFVSVVALAFCMSAWLFRTGLLQPTTTAWLAIPVPLLVCAVFMGASDTEHIMKCIALVVAAICVIGVYGDSGHESRMAAAFYAERAAQFASGVSPIVPAACLFSILCWISVCQRRRIKLINECPIVSPFPIGETVGLAGVSARISDLRSVINRPPCIWFNRMSAAFIGLTVSFVVFAPCRNTYEDMWFTWFIRIGVLIALTSIGILLMQAFATWACLASLLKRLAWHGMAPAYGRLPNVLRREFSAQLFTTPPGAVEIEVSLRYWESLASAAASLKPAALRRGLGPLVTAVEDLQRRAPRTALRFTRGLLAEGVLWRSPISIATGRGSFLEENFVGSSEAEARAGSVVK
ncbi:MAG TPA: hypothetical protein VJ783_04450 [Pirellulales bacterium]|nr:hypothetical protein [Pirellulales bacterium]